MRRTLKASFECKTANREHTCIYCGNTIHKGTKYYSRPENSEEVRRLLEEETGYDIYTIKRRTRLFYCDKISWPFCSWECMRDFAAYTRDTLPLHVQVRMDLKIAALVKNVKEVIHLMTALGGSEGKRREE